jgi:cupin 2 domain-containing protein
MLVQNIYSSLPENLPDELTETLVSTDGARIERIVSHGQASPEGFWYDQPEHEFVLLLSGAARLRFADVDEILELKPGDYLVIPAHRRHRVEWTSPNAPSVWLAVFFCGSAVDQSASR